MEDLEELTEDNHPQPKKCKEEKKDLAKLKKTESRKLTKPSTVEMLEKKFHQKAELKEK